MSTEEKSSPIEVWLTQNNMTINCMIVRQDETTHHLDVESLSMRGAQREMTGYFLREGYEPVGRWETDTEGESMRRFKLKA